MSTTTVSIDVVVARLEPAERDVVLAYLLETGAEMGKHVITSTLEGEPGHHRGFTVATTLDFIHTYSELPPSELGVLRKWLDSFLKEVRALTSNNKNCLVRCNVYFYKLMPVMEFCSVRTPESAWVSPNQWDIEELYYEDALKYERRGFTTASRGAGS